MAVDIQAAFGGYDALDVFSASDYYGGLPFSGYGNGYSYLPFWRDNYKRGEVIPVYITEPELKFMRDRSRLFAASNETYISALLSRRNYITGTGFTYRALPVEDEGEQGSGQDSLCEKTQRFIDIWREANDVAEREAESVERVDVDGDGPVRLFYQWSGDMAGMTFLRFMEPELLRSPTNNASDNTSFGIQNAPGDVENIVGYWVVEDPNDYYTPTFVPEAEVVMFKGNSRTSAKRGVPLSYAIEDNLRRCTDLLQSMTSMAKTRAKIAMIRKMKASGKTAAQNFTDNLTEVTVTNPLTQTVQSMERLAPASILTTDGQKEYEFPFANVDAGGFVACLDAEYRAIAQRLKMPEWMLSANSGNANYSNTFVAESDSVKNFEFLQSYYKRKWGEGRYGQKTSVLWRCIDHAIAVGVLPAEVRTKVRIVVEAPLLAVRDKDREAATYKLYRDMNVYSRQTVQQLLGLDGQHEDKLIREDEFKPEEPAEGTQVQGETPVQRKRDSTGKKPDGNDTQVRSAAVRKNDRTAAESEFEALTREEEAELDRQTYERFAAILDKLDAKIDRMATSAIAESRVSGGGGNETHYHLPSSEGICDAIRDGIKESNKELIESNKELVKAVVEKPVAPIEPHFHVPPTPPAEHHHHVEVPVTVQPASVAIPPHPEPPKSITTKKNEDGSYTSTRD